MENAFDLLLESRLKQPHKTHHVVVPRLRTFIWRIQLGNGAYLIFTIPVGMTFWGLEEHEPPIVTLFLTIVTRREWR